MNNKLKIGMLLLIVALVLAPGASAYSSYVTPLNTLYGSGLSCGTCHVDPNGGGQRNAYGTLFENQANHQTNPTAALTAIGSPVSSTPTLVLTTITVSPSIASKLVGGTQTFTAAGFDQNGGSISISPVAVWSSSNTTVGTIDSATGVFTALEAGMTTIIATNGTDGTVIGIAGATVTVPGISVLTTIKVSPSKKSLKVNGTQTFTATAFDQMGHLISAIFTWVSSNPIVGTIDATGKFTALSAGTTTITAANGTINGSAIVSVGALPHKGKHEQEENEQQDEQEHTNTHEHSNTVEHTNTQVHKGTTDKNKKDKQKDD